MPRFKRKFFKYIKPVLLGLAAAVTVLVIFMLVKVLLPVADFAQKNRFTPAFFISLALEKEPRVHLSNGRFNLVVLGVSGGNHDGANLTDSINFFSIDFKKKDAVMVSVPRDIWLPSLKTKINSVYYYGEKKKSGGGPILTKSAVSEVLGQSSSYAVKMDFTAFEKIIDLIGGVDIDVEKGFEDRFYPIPGKENDFCAGDPEFLCRFETLRFDNRLQHMDGARALKYVRSRFSGDGEGTDFSRSRRQHQVISAITQKIKEMTDLKNISKLKSIFDEAYKYLETDLTLSEMMSLGKYYLFNSDIKIRQVVLDTGDDVKKIPGLLVNPPLWEFNGIWVLTPRTGDYQEIHEYIACELTGSDCNIKPDK